LALLIQFHDYVSAIGMSLISFRSWVFLVAALHFECYATCKQEDQCMLTLQALGLSAAANLLNELIGKAPTSLSNGISI